LSSLPQHRKIWRAQSACHCWWRQWIAQTDRLTWSRSL